MIQVTVNGSAQRYDAPLAVADLVQKMALGGRKVAVEKNGEIVPKSAHASTLIADGEQLEVPKPCPVTAPNALNSAHSRFVPAVVVPAFSRLTAS